MSGFLTMRIRRPPLLHLGLPPAPSENRRRAPPEKAQSDDGCRRLRLITRRPSKETQISIERRATRVRHRLAIAVFPTAADAQAARAGRCPVVWATRQVRTARHLRRMDAVAPAPGTRRDGLPTIGSVATRPCLPSASAIRRGDGRRPPSHRKAIGFPARMCRGCTPVRIDTTRGPREILVARTPGRADHHEMTTVSARSATGTTPTGPGLRGTRVGCVSWAARTTSECRWAMLIRAQTRAAAIVNTTVHCVAGEPSPLRVLPRLIGLTNRRRMASVTEPSIHGRTTQQRRPTSASCTPSTTHRATHLHLEDTPRRPNQKNPHYRVLMQKMAVASSFRLQ